MEDLVYSFSFWFNHFFRWCAILSLGQDLIRKKASVVELGPGPLRVPSSLVFALSSVLNDL